MEHDRTARNRILDATLAAAADHGIARLSVGDVAHLAGLSRQTLYKYFPSKQALVSEAVAREAADVVRQVVSAAEQFDDPGEALFAGVFTTLSVARDHPLLDRLLRTEPESILSVLIAPDGPVVGLARTAIDEITASRFAEVAPARRAVAADALARLLVSYAVGPPDVPPEELARSLTSMIIGGVLAPGPVEGATSPGAVATG